MESSIDGSKIKFRNNVYGINIYILVIKKRKKYKILLKYHADL